MKRNICAGLAMLMATALPSFAQQNDRLLQLLKSELTYNMGELQKQESKPYFMSFRVEDSYQATLVSSFGVTATADTNSSRVFIPQIRVGNMQLDNFKYNTQGGNASARGKAPTAYLPKDGASEAALKIAIWEETLRRFNIAEARYRGAQNTVADLGGQRRQGRMFLARSRGALLRAAAAPCRKPLRPCRLDPKAQ